jgi:hypothetical protein
MHLAQHEISRNRLLNFTKLDKRLTKTYEIVYLTLQNYTVGHSDP